MIMNSVSYKRATNIALTTNQVGSLIMQKIPARKKLLFFITLITTSFVASAQNGWSAEIEMEGSEGTTLTGKVMATFDQPWAMTFLPDGHSLVTEKEGVIWLLDKNQQKRFSVENVPDVTARGQGGLGDVIIHPEFATNKTVYVSYVERDPQDDALFDRTSPITAQVCQTVKLSGANHLK